MTDRSALGYLKNLQSALLKYEGTDLVNITDVHKFTEAICSAVNALNEKVHRIETTPLNTDKGLDLPEATDEIAVPEFMTEMKKEVDKLWDSWNVLKGKLCQAERRIERLEK